MTNMMSDTFYNYIQQYRWEEVEQSIYDKTKNDVIDALNRPYRTLDDFAALISPAAAPFIEEMAVISNKTTLERFGKTMQLYIPLYLSNYCQNSCTYCGFSSSNQIKRKSLTFEEIQEEIEAIKKLRYKHILLVSGEAPSKADVDYFVKTCEMLRTDFSQIALEVQPLDYEEYVRLQQAGISFVCIYQETYNEKKYPEYHLRGKKADYKYRLETPDRIGKANIQKIGLGVLLGLENWRTDSFFTALHIHYLEKKYWKTKYSISMPRLRPAEGGFQPNYPISDKELVQLICAYRLWNKDAEISISTREGKEFRDNILPLGVTSMSAGSSTEPGGYAHQNKALEQFSIDDARTPEEMAKAIKERGYEVVWQDWNNWM